MSTPVTAQYLLEGAVYSLERCGELLCDSNALYRNGSYATAVALALFAREDLGRWQILLGLRRDVVGGARITIEEIRRRCKPHVAKQHAGMTGITMRDPGLGKLLQARTAAASAPASKEFKTTSDQLERRAKTLTKRIPDDRDNLRMLALYVDPLSVDRWNRPATEISKRCAYEVITDAVDGYVRHWDERYVNPELFKDDDPELFEALTHWADRPKLARPENLPFEQ